MPHPIPVILDTDIGDDVDDVYALALALQSPELELVGVTTVYGDTAKRAQLARAVLQAFGRGDVPVAAGITQPLLGAEGPDEPQHYRGIDAPEELSSFPPGQALSFMVERVEHARRPITLCAIGPLTNLAVFLAARRDLAARVRIVLMGGMVGGQRREHNVSTDPEAAQIVLASGASIIQVGLDVTLSCQMSPGDVDRIAQAGYPSTDIIARLTAIWQEQSHRPPTLHDPLAVAMCFDPRLCQTKPMRVHVQTTAQQTRGLTTAQPDPHSSVQVCTSVDAGRLVRLVCDRLCRPPR